MLFVGLVRDEVDRIFGPHPVLKSEVRSVSCSFSCPSWKLKGVEPGPSPTTRSSARSAAATTLSTGRSVSSRRL